MFKLVLLFLYSYRIIFYVIATVVPWIAIFFHNELIASLNLLEYKPVENKIKIYLLAYFPICICRNVVKDQLRFKLVVNSRLDVKTLLILTLYIVFLFWRTWVIDIIRVVPFSRLTYNPYITFGSNYAMVLVSLTDISSSFLYRAI